MKFIKALRDALRLQDRGKISRLVARAARSRANAALLDQESLEGTLLADLIASFAKEGEIGPLGLLLNAGAPSDIPDSCHRHLPLEHACYWCRADAVRLLISKGAEVATILRRSHVFDAVAGDTPTLKAVLDGGMCPNAANSDGTTLLMAAANAGNDSGIRLLADRGANPNAVDNDGETALDYVGSSGALRTRSLLLNIGAKCEGAEECRPSD